MVRLLLGLWMAAAGAKAEGLLLKGFSLVDPAARSVAVGDLWIDAGKVVAKAPASYRTIDGKGRWLMPAFWDLDSSLWGNDSAFDYHVLSQNMSIPYALRVQLFYGVAHCGGSHLDQGDLDTEFKRLQSLEIPAAEMLYLDKALGGPGGKAWACYPITQSAQIGPILDTQKSEGLPFVQLLYGDPKDKFSPGLSRDLLADGIKQAQQRGLKAYVFINSWAHAQDAVELGAAAIAGLPPGLVPAKLPALMRRKNCAYAPYLALNLELPRLLGNPPALHEPFLEDSVSRPVLDSFLDPSQLWERWKSNLSQGRAVQADALKSLGRLGASGVKILNATSSGWCGGDFQGYATHAGQAWMEKAGLDAWTRLSAATLWPAAFAGRKIGFEAGEGADFVALDADPLSGADALHTIDFVVRDGNEIDRAALKPDLSRQKFRPYR